MHKCEYICKNVYVRNNALKNICYTINNKMFFNKIKIKHNKTIPIVF